MELNIDCFGVAKDIVGAPHFRLEVAEPLPAAELKRRIAETYPAFAELKSFLLAVNEAYATDDQMVRPEDTIVIIPPVSGG
jgi:molybdopterin converting factor small subunit